MADFGRLIWGPARDPITKRASAYTIDASGESVGGRMVLPKSGTVTHVGWSLGTKTGSPPNYYVGMVTVTATTGNLTTTAYGGSTPATVDPTALSVGWQWSALAANATAVAGDQVGIRIWPTGSPGNPDASNNISCIYAHHNSMHNDPNSMNSFTLDGQVWVSKLPIFALRYSDGSVIGYPYRDDKFSLYDSADSPDEAGVRFTLPYAMRCSGVCVNMSMIDSDAGYTLRLMDSANAILSSWVVADEDRLSDYGISYLYWSSALILAASPTYYRLTFMPSSSSLRIRPASMVFGDANEQAVYHAASDFVATSRTDEGEWTDDENATVFVGLIIDDITLPTGGGRGARWL